jgi:hypothetical protein
MKLTPAQKQSGRRYPHLVDNMRVVTKAKRLGKSEHS